jgi:hypothetical protein
MATRTTQALRIYFGFLQQAHERVALVAGPQPTNSGKYAKYMTDEELRRIAAPGLEKRHKKVESDTYRVRIESAVVPCGSCLAFLRRFRANDYMRLLQIKAFIRTYPDLTRFPDSRFYVRVDWIL